MPSPGCLWRKASQERPTHGRPGWERGSWYRRTPVEERDPLFLHPGDSFAPLLSLRRRGDEASQDMTVMRDFLDIINAPFYPLFFRCWAKYRQVVKVVEEEDPAYLER